ncbi:fasciclin domain-containing protein [Mesobacterium pallidum]|uniref:fasciclin domain-containing protein n=1 Tax=Mesobacterium pallidum TaxID=2872037 RepID=UPI001EE394EC|nr:fasciclin domain-containing protein [Mesobacterium pallidum]
MFRKTMIALTTATAMTTAAFAGGHSMDIVDTAMGNEDFETLVAAVSAAELVDALKGEGPFTVFAPTDAAFDALPEGTLEELLKPENKAQLIEILTYHVVPGKIMSSDIMMQPTEVETLQGTTVTVTGLDSGVTVDGGTVEMADIETSNGVIHVINKVLMP